METESESYQHQLDDVYLIPSTVSEVDSQSKLSRMLLFVIFFFSLYFVFAAAATTTRDVNTARTIDSNKLLLQKTKRPDTDLFAEIGIETSSPDYPELSSLEYLPWENVIEPYRNQTLAVSSVVIDGKDVLSNGKMKDYIFHWNINDYFFEGEEITVNLPFVGVYDCNVSLIDQSEGATYTSNFTLAIKYVRREIKSLTDTDRDDFFSALQILYTVNMSTGTALYGEKYANAEYFLYKHLTGAGRSDCDHWHDGAAFPTIHTAFTLFAEQALQSINPSIAMPYWEYAQVAFPFNLSFFSVATYLIFSFLSRPFCIYYRINIFMNIGLNLKYSTKIGLVQHFPSQNTTTLMVIIFVLPAPLQPWLLFQLNWASVLLLLFFLFQMEYGRI